MQLEVNFASFQIKGKIVYHTTESISCLGPKIWDIIPDDYKTIGHLVILKFKLKNGNQKNNRVGQAKFPLIRQVFFNKTKKSELFVKNRSFLYKSYKVVQLSVKTYLHLIKAYTTTVAWPILLLVADMQTDKWQSGNLL